MEITVNEKKYHLEQFCTVEQMLAIVMESGAKGIAVAINQNIVSKKDWSVCKLSDGDQVMLIKATQGG